jgi:uncharacterized membrane protein YfcA
MSILTLALLGLTILVSSFISGVFGMAGGMILLGVLLNYFDVPSAMILFSIIQFCANAWRAFQWRQYVLWPIFLAYGFGASVAFVAMYAIAFVPNKTMVYLSLGIMPFVIEALPRTMRPNIECWPASADCFSTSSFRRACSTAKLRTPPRPRCNR